MAADYGIAQLHEIDEIDDGREPFRPCATTSGSRPSGSSR